MPVGLVIVSHSAQLAAGVAELANQMSQGKVPIAPAGGAGENIIGTSTDTILSAEMALEFLDEEVRNRVQLTAAPLVEGAVAAAIDASLGHALAEVRQAAERVATKEQLQLLKPISQPEAPETFPFAPSAPPPPPTSETAEPALEITLPITNPTGLHARPAALFVQTADHYDARIEVFAHGRQAPATNLIGVLSLDIRQGDTITLRARGPQAEAALAAIGELVRANFNETEPAQVVSPAPALALAATPAPQAQEQLRADPGGEIWKGVPTSPGVALGPALVVSESRLSLKNVEQQHIAPGQVAAEQQRLRAALRAAENELHALTHNVQSSVGAEQAAIFEAQALMLSDEALIDEALNTIATQQISAASALARAGEEQALLLERLDNELLAARAVDVRDAVNRALRHLRDQSDQAGVALDLSTLTTPVILLAHDLTPSDTAQLRPEMVLGICTVSGGPTAHAAILARALGIPSLAGLDEAALQIIHTGDELGLDADAGLLYMHPAPEIHAQLSARIVERQVQRAALQAEAQQAQA